MGTAATGDRVVMPTTRMLKSTLAHPMVLRMDQLSSKYTGTTGTVDIAAMVRQRTLRRGRRLKIGIGMP